MASLLHMSDFDGWAANVEERITELELQQVMDTLALTVAKSEAERIVWLIRAHLAKVGSASAGNDRYLSKIELAAQRIISEINHSNERPESVQEMPPGLGLRKQDQEELPNSNSD